MSKLTPFTIQDFFSHSGSDEIILRMGIWLLSQIKRNNFLLCKRNIALFCLFRRLRFISKDIYLNIILHYIHKIRKRKYNATSHGYTFRDFRKAVNKNEKNQIPPLQLIQEMSFRGPGLNSISSDVMHKT